jgi:hypothetical protein
MSQITANDPILATYIEQRAARSGEDAAEIAAQIDRNTFYENVYALHQRFMSGEFSLGYMAQLLGITKPDLYHLLDAMELKVTNV